MFLAPAPATSSAWPGRGPAIGPEVSVERTVADPFPRRDGRDSRGRRGLGSVLDDVTEDRGDADHGPCAEELGELNNASEPAVDALGPLC
jgi:hypothetical protein